MTYDYDKMKRAIELFLEAIGEDTSDSRIKDTPNRCARMYGKILNGYDDDPKRHLVKFDEQTSDEYSKNGNIISLTNVPYYGFCEHHLVLFAGTFNVAYVPRDGKVLGMSKLVRIMRVFAKKLQIQERLTNEIADFLVQHVSEDVSVKLTGTHFCCSIRGARAPGIVYHTNADRGRFVSDGKLQQEFQQAIITGRQQGEFRY